MDDEILEAEFIDGSAEEDYRPWGMDLNTFNMLLHLSPLAGVVVPLAGLVLPILMWTTNKDHSKAVSAHGKVVINWMISSFLLIVVSAVLGTIIPPLWLIVVGILVCDIIFAIIGATKAKEGIVYRYPFTFVFIT